VLLTLAIFALILRRVPFPALAAALGAADYTTFLALMIPNTLFYFAWDTLVLTVVIRWFHGPVAYRDLLPVRAASYVVGFFNTNLGRGAMAAYLSRRLQAPFLELGSTVIFLVLTEYTQLVLWAMLGLLGFRAEVSRSLLAVAAGVAIAWLAVRWLLAPRAWAIFRTFRLATPSRYASLASTNFRDRKFTSLRARGPTPALLAAGASLRLHPRESDRTSNQQQSRPLKSVEVEYRQRVPCT